MRAHTLPLRSAGTRCRGLTGRSPVASPSPIAACSAAQRPGPSQQPSGATHKEVDVQGIVRASVVAAMALSLVAAPKAYAEGRPWKPRRHYRRMGERISDTWALEAVEMEESLRDRAWEVREQERKLKLQRQEEEFQKMKKEQEARLKRAEQMMTHVEASRSKPIAIRVGGVDVLPYLFWGSIITFVLWASRSIWQNAQQRQRGPGKWVYDRSLGGKKVWVPDAAAPGSDSALRVRTEEFERLASVAAAARQKAERGSQRVPGMPSWWNLPPTSFASPEVKAAKQVEADRLLTRIEQAKNRGEDYNLRDILELRAVCQEGGVSVRTKTVGARDGIYQTAVDAAIVFAQDRSNTVNNIGDQESEFPESRLLTGLAGDLNMPEERAVTLVRQAVAATCRARLLEAVRLLKESNEMDSLVALMRMSGLLQNIPALSDGTTEPELIASSLQTTSTVEDRRKIFYILGQLQMDSANLFAEMLGFEPALVVPKLHADVESYRQQQRAAEAATA